MDLDTLRDKIDYHIARAEHYDAIVSAAEDEALAEILVHRQWKKYHPLWVIQRLARENNEYLRCVGKRDSHLKWAQVYAAQLQAHMGGNGQ